AHASGALGGVLHLERLEGGEKEAEECVQRHRADAEPARQAGEPPERLLEALPRADVAPGRAGGRVGTRERPDTQTTERSTTDSHVLPRHARPLERPEV